MITVKSSFFKCFVQLYDTINHNALSSDVQIIFSRFCNHEVKSHKIHIYLSLCNIKNAQQTKLKLFVIDKVTEGLRWNNIIAEISQINSFSLVFSIDRLLIFCRACQQEIIDCLNRKTFLTEIAMVDCDILESTKDAIKHSSLLFLQHI